MNKAFRWKKKKAICDIIWLICYYTSQNVIVGQNSRKRSELLACKYFFKWYCITLYFFVIEYL